MAPRSLPIVLALLYVSISASAMAQGRIIGIVREEGGRPLQGASITAENPDVVPSTFTVTSDDKGRFVILGLRPGVWTVTAQAGGFTPSQNRLRVRSVVSNTPIEPLEIVLPRGAAGRPNNMLAGINMKDLQGMLDKANGLYDAGAFDQAIAVYQSILQKAPALTAVHLQIGHAYRQKKEYDRALAKYRDVLRSGVVTEQARIAIAMISVEQGDLPAAATALTAAAEAPEASAEVFYQLGELKRLQKQPEEASRWYERAQAREPGWGEPLLKLGLLALERGDRTKAGEYFAQFLQNEPNSPDADQARALMEQIRQ